MLKLKKKYEHGPDCDAVLETPPTILAIVFDEQLACAPPELAVSVICNSVLKLTYSAECS